jgi:hypothetical protein
LILDTSGDVTSMANLFGAGTDPREHLEGAFRCVLSLTAIATRLARQRSLVDSLRPVGTVTGTGSRRRSAQKFDAVTPLSGKPIVT